MEDSILGSWRDVAIVILVVEMAVMVLVPGVIFYFAIRGMRWVNRNIRAPLLTARVWALRVQLGADRASRATVALPIATEALDMRVRATVRGLAEFFGLQS